MCGKCAHGVSSYNRDTFLTTLLRHKLCAPVFIERLRRFDECEPGAKRLNREVPLVMKQKNSIWRLLKSTVAQWIEDQPFQMASSLAYYTIFSLAPPLIIVIAIAGFAFGEQAAEQQIVEKIQGTIGQQGAEAVQRMIQNASSQPKTGMISAIVGFVALLFGAGGVVGQLRTSLNTIWGVAPKPGQGVWGFMRQRFISFAMILGIGFLLLVRSLSARPSPVWRN